MKLKVLMVSNSEPYSILECLEAFLRVLGLQEIQYLKKLPATYRYTIGRKVDFVATFVANSTSISMS